MDPDVRIFLHHWVRKVEKDRFQQLGRLMGVLFTAGEIRTWNKGEGKGVFADQDPVSVPLTIAFRPELRDGLMRLVGGLTKPKDVKFGENEVVIDLGATSIEDFKAFVETHRQGEAARKESGSLSQ
jgi:hypothetical protein